MHIQMVLSVASARVLEVMSLRIARLTATASYEESSINSVMCVGDYYLQVDTVVPIAAGAAFSTTTSVIFAIYYLITA